MGRMAAAAELSAGMTRSTAISATATGSACVAWALAHAARRSALGLLRM